jgi:hypothetical protein
MRPAAFVVSSLHYSAHVGVAVLQCLSCAHQKVHQIQHKEKESLKDTYKAKKGFKWEKARKITKTRQNVGTQVKNGI